MVGSSLRALPRHFAKLLIVLLCFLANLYAFDLNAHLPSSFLVKNILVNVDATSNDLRILSQTTKLPTSGIGSRDGLNDCDEQSANHTGSRRNEGPSFCVGGSLAVGTLRTG
jgi:hypothetical protein